MFNISIRKSLCWSFRYNDFLCRAIPQNFFVSIRSLVWEKRCKKLKKLKNKYYMLMRTHIAEFAREFEKYFEIWLFTRLVFRLITTMSFKRISTNTTSIAKKILLRKENLTFIPFLCNLLPGLKIKFVPILSKEKYLI